MAGLNVLIQRLEHMAATDVKHRIMVKVADVAHAECVRGFHEQRNPYGTPWARRKPPKAWAVRAFGLMQQDHPLLDKTGAMLNSISARAAGDRVVMRILGYAKFHQSGTSNMAARKICPEQAQGLGLWSAPINRAAVDAVRELAQGKR